MPNTMAVRRAIRSRIKTYLIDPHPEIVWILREDVQRKPTPSVKHVIIDIVPGRSRLVGTGNPRLFRTRGVLTCRIATPMTDGAGPNEEIAELMIHPHFRALLDSAVSPPVLYYTPTWAPSEVPDEQWFVGRSVVEWRADYNEA